MSWDMGAWARGQRTGSTAAKCILLLLADEADTLGYCQPTQESLAASAECSDDTVSRHVLALVKAGLVARRRTRRADGKYARWEYKLQAPGCPETFDDLADARAGRPHRRLRGGDGATHEDPVSGPRTAGPAGRASTDGDAHEAPSTPAQHGALPADQVVADMVRTAAPPVHPADCGVDGQPHRNLPAGHDASSQVSTTPHPAGPQIAASKPPPEEEVKTSSSPRWTPQIAAWTDQHAAFVDEFASHLSADVADRLPFDPSGAPTVEDRLERPDDRLSKFAAQVLRLVAGGWPPDVAARRATAVGPLADAGSVAAVLASRLSRLPAQPVPAVRRATVHVHREVGTPEHAEAEARNRQIALQRAGLADWSS